MSGSPASSVTVPAIEPYRHSGITTSPARSPGSSLSGAGEPSGRRLPYAPSAYPGFEAVSVKAPFNSFRKTNWPLAFVIARGVDVGPGPVNSGSATLPLSVTIAPAIGRPELASTTRPRMSAVASGGGWFEGAEAWGDWAAESSATVHSTAPTASMRCLPGSENATQLYQVAATSAFQMPNAKCQMSKTRSGERVRL